MKSTRTARVYRATPRNIAFLANRLRAGELVAVPTETVYGLAANALDASACSRIFRAKGRPTTDPLIVHLGSPEQLAAICRPNAAAMRLAAAFWPGPLTLILPKLPAIPEIVTAGGDSVAVRMPSHPLFRKLLERTGLPLAAPSANPFGYISPTTAEHVRANLGTRIRHILDGGPSAVGLESTIVDIRDGHCPAILRFGAITGQEVERVLGRKVAVRGTKRVAGPQLAPGQLARHYSPKTPLVLHANLDERFTAAPREAVVFLRRPRKPASNTFWFDARGDLRGVARQLFAVLRKLDAEGYTRIHVELAPNAGLGCAINDRLQRAAAR